MKAIRKMRSSRFTLVELLVAMAVFSILMLLMVQFFSTSQRIWVNMEQKNNLYADARVAMDLITTLLQGTYFSKGNVPYRLAVKNTDTNDIKDKDSKYVDEYNSKIYFPTQSQIDLIEDTGKIIFVSIQRATSISDKQGQLRMAILSDKYDDFSLFFPPYMPENKGFETLKKARDEIKGMLDDIIKENKTAEEGNGATTDGKICVTLLNNVTSFRMIPRQLNNDKTFDTQSTTYVDKIPYIIDIQLSIMSEKDYDFWWNELKASSRKESEQATNYRLAHEHTFTRTVYIGDRPNNDTVF